MSRPAFMLRTEQVSYRAVEHSRATHSSYQSAEFLGKLPWQLGTASQGGQFSHATTFRPSTKMPRRHVPQRGSEADRPSQSGLAAIRCYIAAHTIMLSGRRGLSGLKRGALGAALLILASSACTPLIGGAVLIGLVGVGALTSRCYDYLDVTVFDADGRKTCAATVTASDGRSQFELTSCYYAPLTDGHWTLRASLPGTPEAFSTVEVEHVHDCTRHVQTVELTMNRAGAPSAPRPLVPARPVVASPPPPTSESGSPAPSAPPLVPTGSSATPPESAEPATSAAPPVGVFPDRSESSH